MSIFPQKVLAVGAASQNKISSIVRKTVLTGSLSLAYLSAIPFLTSTDSAFGNSPPAPASPETPTDSHPAINCEILSRGPEVQLLQQEARLHSFVNELLTVLRSDKYESLSNFFHPGTRVGSKVGTKIHTLLRNRYDQPWQFSVFRIWRLTSKEGTKGLVRTCPDNDGAIIITQYGHETQYALWLQIMGQNELGRLVLAVAPIQGKMQIVGFRIQQWTELGEDAESWTKRAQSWLQQNERIQAYFAFDVAQKLLAGEDFVIYPQQRALREARDELFTQAKIVKLINDQLKTQSIAYVGGLVAKDGTGILIREIVAPDESTHKLHDLCLKRGSSLKRAGWLREKQGLRCNFIVAGMDPTQDSPLGGFYLSPSDLKNPEK